MGKKRKTRKIVVVTEEEAQPADCQQRPRLVRQLSGATGVRTLSPREPSPKPGHPALASASRVFLTQSGIQIQPPSAGEAMVVAHTFEAAAGLYGDELVAAIRADVRSPRPTPIQAVCWALAAPSVARPRPRDLIAVAETGAGKTFAFLLPAVARVRRSAAVPSPVNRHGLSPVSLCVSVCVCLCIYGLQI